MKFSDHGITFEVSGFRCAKEENGLLDVIKEIRFHFVYCKVHENSVGEGKTTVRVFHVHHLKDADVSNFVKVDDITPEIVASWIEEMSDNDKKNIIQNIFDTIEPKEYLYQPKFAVK